MIFPVLVNQPVQIEFKSVKILTMRWNRVISLKFLPRRHFSVHQNLQQKQNNNKFYISLFKKLIHPATLDEVTFIHFYDKYCFNPQQ